MNKALNVMSNSWVSMTVFVILLFGWNPLPLGPALETIALAVVLTAIINRIFHGSALNGSGKKQREKFEGCKDPR